VYAEFKNVEMVSSVGGQSIQSLRTKYDLQLEGGQGDYALPI